MYNVKFLLSAIDSFTASAHERLTAAELQLLADIRGGIAENRNEQKVEEHFLLLINFLMLIMEYVNKTGNNE